MYRLLMVFINVIIDITIYWCSFVFGRQSRANPGVLMFLAGFTDVSGVAVAAFDLVYSSLSVLLFVFVHGISN